MQMHQQQMQQPHQAPPPATMPAHPDPSQSDGGKLKASKEPFEWEIPYPELAIGDVLGEGTFGLVFAFFLLTKKM